MSIRTPADPQTRPNAEGPGSLRSADHDAVADWLAHVQAGRIGSHLRPTASLLEAGNPPVDPAIRAIVLANERLICGDGTLPIW